MAQWRNICLLVAVNMNFILGSSKCRFENANADEETNICYHKRDAKALSCPRDEKLVINNIVHRVNKKCAGHEVCCKPRSNDKDYDIGHCLGDREPYRSAMREVLEECSQKRYCVLVSEVGSLIHQLRNTTVDGGKRAVSLVTAHQCVKDIEPTVSFCKNNSVPHSKYVYISSQGLSLSDDNNCTCDVETTGNTNVTLLDVRLGTDPGNKLLLQTNTENEFTGGEDSLYFGHRVLVTDSRWKIHLSLSRHRVPGNVWMKVEGNKGSEIKVTCYEPWGKTDQATPSLELKTTSTTQTSSHYLPYVMFVVGFIVACILLGVKILIVKFLNNRNSASMEEMSPKSTSTGGTAISSVDMDCEEPLYSSASQPSTQGSFSTRKESVSTWQEPFYNRLSSVRGTAGHPDQTKVESDYYVPNYSRPVPKPRSQSKPDLRIYSTANGNSFRKNMKELESQQSTEKL